MTDPAGPSPIASRPAAAPEPADVVAAAVRGVPGVADLHAGMFGEVGTYLPGRRIPGVRLGESDTDIHVSIVFGAPVRETAQAVRRAVAPLVVGPVCVSIEDVLPADARRSGAT